MDFMTKPEEGWLLEEIERYTAEVIPKLLSDHLSLTQASEVYLFASDAMVSLSRELFTVRGIGKNLDLKGGVKKTTTAPGWQQLVPGMLKILHMDQKNMLRCSVPIAADMVGEGEMVLAAHVGLAISLPTNRGYDPTYDPTVKSWQSHKLPEEKPTQVRTEVDRTVDSIEELLDGGYEKAVGYDWNKVEFRLWRLDIFVLFTFTLDELHMSVYRIGHDMPLTLHTIRWTEHYRYGTRTRELAAFFGQLTSCELIRIRAASVGFDTDMFPFVKTNFVPRDPLPRLEKGLTWAQQNKQRSERCSGPWRFQPRPGAKAEYDAKFSRWLAALAKTEEERQKLYEYRPDTPPRRKPAVLRNVRNKPALALKTAQNVRNKPAVLRNVGTKPALALKTAQNVRNKPAVLRNVGTKPALALKPAQNVRNKSPVLRNVGTKPALALKTAQNVRNKSPVLRNVGTKPALALKTAQNVRNKSPVLRNVGTKPALALKPAQNVRNKSPVLRNVGTKPALALKMAQTVRNSKAQHKNPVVQDKSRTPVQNSRLLPRKLNNKTYVAPSVPQNARYLLPKHGVVLDRVVRAGRAQAMKKLIGS